MKQVRIPLTAMVLLLMFCLEGRAQRHSSAVMQVTARVLKAPESLEWKTADRVEVHPVNLSASFGTLTLPDRRLTAYLLSISREISIPGASGNWMRGKLRSRETVNRDGTVSCVLKGQFEKGTARTGTDYAGGGAITATIEYY